MCDVVGALGNKTVHVSFLSHSPTRMQETRRGRGGSGVQLNNNQNRTCFLFPTCVFFPNYARAYESHRKEESKKTSFFSSTTQSKEVGRKWGAEFLPFSFKNRASCSLCWVLFVCISYYSLGRPRMKGRKKDSGPTAFDVRFLWSHVSALSVKSFCCPLA